MIRQYLLCTLFFASLAPKGAAQAWVPAKGEGTFSTSYSFISSDGHFTSSGSRVAEAAAKSQAVIFEVELGVTDRLAFTVSLPIVAARYADSNPSSSFLRNLFNQTLQAAGPGTYSHGFLDDGAYHPTVADFQFEARYNVAARPVMLTPFVAVTLPSHDYAYVGEAAPGRNLREFVFGANFGRTLAPFLPKAYSHAQLAFAIPQESLNVRTNRMDLSLEAGYAITHRLDVRAFGLWKDTLRGLHFPADLTTPEITLTHERLLKAKYWHVGGGGAYALSRKTEIGADVVFFVAGSDTHYGEGVAVHISHSFEFMKMQSTRR